MVRTRWGFRTAVLAAGLASLVGGCAGGPKHRATLEQFRGMKLEELTGLQGTITYLGTDMKPIPSLGFAAVGHRFDARRFTLWHKEEPRWHYLHDYLVPFRFVATPEELKTLIDSVGTLPDMTDGHADSSGAISFTLLNAVEGDTLAFETTLDAANGRRLFAKLLGAMSANTDAMQELRGMGCVTDLLPLARPRDATKDVKVELLGNPWPDPTTRECAMAIHVTNLSRRALKPPLTLVLRPKRTVEWMEAEGRTCRVDPPGLDFVTLPIDTLLASKGLVEMAARFRTPYDGPIRFATIKVFEGPGSR